MSMEMQMPIQIQIQIQIQILILILILILIQIKRLNKMHCRFRMKKKNSAFFVCDIQETFRHLVVGMPELIATSVFLTKCARVLEIPVIASEQQPFKPTVAELDATGWSLYKKTKFSMCIDAVKEKIKEMKHLQNIYLFGIETHVCVLQTALDLLREGYRVYLVSDAVSSQRIVDRQVALERLGRAGVIITTAESAIYELLKDAKHRQFKLILPLVKDLAKDLNKDNTANHPGRQSTEGPASAAAQSTANQSTAASSSSSSSSKL